MPSNKKDKELNRIKAATADAKSSSLLLALYLNIDPTTVSKWNTNTSQPSLSNINEIGEFYEVNNTEIIKSKIRNTTGVAEAAQNELKRLMEIGENPYLFDENGALTKKLNPKMVKTIKEFVEKYKKTT